VSEVSSQPPLPPPPGMTPVPEAPAPPASEREPRDVLPVLLALALAVTVAVGAVALVSWARGGGGCESGSFESRRFGYCVRAPSGWTAVAAENAGSPLDRFFVQDGAATITVTAVPLTQGQDLARFEQFVRGYVEDAGATTDASHPVTVDGVEGVAFDARLDGDDAQIRSREVLFARDGFAWRVTLADEQVGFDASARRLDELLMSWRFV
jgi:hypothetical protein